MVPIRFNFNQLKDFDDDMKASEKAIPLVAQRVLNRKLKPLRQELRAQIPRATGRLQRSFGYSVKRFKSRVSAVFGFMTGKKVSKSTAIAANVLQAGGAHPRKGKYLWIPLANNRAADGSAMISPRQLIEAGGFVAVSAAGSTIAFHQRGDPAFVLRTFVKLSKPPLPIEQRMERELPAIISDIEETVGAALEVKKAIEKIL